MNRGHEGKAILADSKDKTVFLELLEESVALYRMRILAYCLMDNHYHLVLENSSGRMSGFFKHLNGRYATWFRKCHGGQGDLFQDRFKSMLIQDDAYLMLVIAYVLNNPVRAGLSRDFLEYPWSSGRFYFGPDYRISIDCMFVEELFGNKSDLTHIVKGLEIDALPIHQSGTGPVIGGEAFLSEAVRRSDRRGSGPESMERKKQDDLYFEPVEKVFMEFEQKHGVLPEDLDSKTFAGKRLRAELLVNLKERAGLRYVDIIRLDAFAGIAINSLGAIYHREKKKGRCDDRRKDAKLCP